jgi:hypothetical protein
VVYPKPAWAAITQVSHAIGGERVAALLPLLLRPGALGKMPKKQRERIRRETGGSKTSMIGVCGCALCRQMSTVLADGCNRLSCLRWDWMFHVVRKS